MSDLYGNHIVGFPTRRLIWIYYCIAGQELSTNKKDLSRLVGKPTMWFLNRSYTNRPVQLQKQARSLKFWSLVEEELYYPSSENKGAD